MIEVILNLNDYENINKFIKLYNFDKNIKLGLNINNKVYYDDKEVENFDVKSKNFWFICCIHAINIKDKYKKYEYIYNKMCDFLDKNVCVLCNFERDKCELDRLGKSVHGVNGCCYFKSLGLCNFLDKGCPKRSLSCKIYMCQHIEKKYKFKSKVDTYPLLRLFFNKKQKDIIHYSYRKSFNEIIDELIRLSK